MDFTGSFGFKDDVNFGIGPASTQDNVVRLHAADGDSVVTGSGKDTITYFGDFASALSSKSRVSTGAGNDSVFLSSGNYGVNLGDGDDLLNAGNGSGTSIVDVYGGAGADQFTLGVFGDHDMIVRDLSGADKWGFRTADSISVCFGTTTIAGQNAITATFGANSFTFIGATLTQVQASCVNVLL